MQKLKVKGHPDLIVGLDTADDAGVYRISQDTALIQTLDFLTPIADDPYTFGQIAAANSLSDVYAMGGRPITAMNIVCFPVKEMDESVLRETLEGGIDKINESGATLVGGHSVEDAEFKYGLSVTGTVHPDRVVTNSGARSGDRLILTKPLGTGIISTALKAKLADEETVREMTQFMGTLNRGACEVMTAHDVGGCTDITGFGLAGHLMEMAQGAKKRLTIEIGRIPLQKKAKDYALMGMVPAGAFKNRDFFKSGLTIQAGVERVDMDLILDPQTSGGLVFSVSPKDAAVCVDKLLEKGVPASVIGEVQGDHTCGELVIAP